MTPGRDWTTMTPGDFRQDAPPATLFDLTPDNVPCPDDGYGTGDLFAELTP